MIQYIKSNEESETFFSDFVLDRLVFYLVLEVFNLINDLTLSVLFVFHHLLLCES